MKTRFDLICSYKYYLFLKILLVLEGLGKTNLIDTSSKHTFKA